ncbi:MAG: OmpA family protein [Thermodesulfobacteriota bacterium]|nr:OmpA family protein [Thermodesulfobacteriota bacterium]
MKTTGLLMICCVLISLIGGCVVTKKSYTSLLSDYTALEHEKQGIEEELSATKAKNDKTISEQKNRISSLEQGLKDLEEKYTDDMAVAASRQDELNQSIATLKNESTEQTQGLLQQITELQEKYDTDIAAKNDTIGTLKSQYRDELETLNNRLDHEIQSHKILTGKLLDQIKILEDMNAEKEKALNKLSQQADQIEKQLRAEIENGEITLKRYKTKTIINIDNSILFDSGQARLKKKVKQSLAKIAQAINRYPENNIQIEGHTDNVPIHTEQFPSNWELSSARALAVLRFFTDKTDMDPRKLSAVGYGEYHPLAPNDTPENKRMNRRVDIVILPGG